MAIKLTKENLAKQMGISRPTLDKYLEEGFPRNWTKPTTESIYEFKRQKEFRKLELETEIQKEEYILNNLKQQLAELKGEDYETDI